MAFTLSTLNQKGGVSKTSVCHHVAGALEKRGLKSLLVDLDYQCNLTQGFFGPVAGTSFPDDQSVIALFQGTRVPAESLVRPTDFPNIFLVPGSLRMTEVSDKNPQDAGARQLILRRFLSQVSDPFDFVFLDCHPDVQLPAWTALVASDYVIVPVQPEEYGVQGVSLMRDVVLAVRAGPNPKLRVGYLITKMKPNVIYHRRYEEMIRRTFGDDVFRARMPLSTKYAEAVSARKPICYYKPSQTKDQGLAVDDIAAELLERAANRNIKEVA